ncbi:ABC transporter ATP-binding protein [Carnobacteriaceae bacterium zg-ZUI78]|uniref:ABC transporter ATP-binding protein n=1 Tax=Granulicatella sp. zg-84 TaxID=2678503 RepID=UPI0013C24676|nr:dipeptide/oligopeptide/nickel ABC transporter ATP-binding protein [Granulicatella sp. zg-84]MBS4749810.1 ABC transporter ATP-binding protein [Carnobacteriaceae bacterium zg-ZUI78]NEW66250.1 ATP-binding cassette domain-containing protein [Granulicatella sp. zg-84]QMI85910.1 ABC transporter ATP-binding protein [Carnobacteriaceae bacterium zg-84]
MSALLKCQELTHQYTKNVGVFDISFDLEKKSVLGLVGESGSGKSTIAHILCRFSPVQKGQILLDGKDISQYSLKDYYKRVQYIPQHPQWFFHPKRTVYKSFEEVLINYELATKSECEALIIESLQSVGLNEHHAHQLPLQLSGGECQRAGIARALLVKPDLLVCDEITSALDVTIQADIMTLLKKIKQERETTFLFISHDLALVSDFCDTSIVLKNGCIMEQGQMKDIVTSPKSDYTKLLLNQYQSFEYNQ